MTSCGGLWFGGIRFYVYCDMALTVQNVGAGNIKVDFDKCIATPQIMSRVSKTVHEFNLL